VNNYPSQFEIVALKWGGKSLRSLEHRETFHPVTGPEKEARLLHVEQQNLLKRALNCKNKFIVWDVGLGAAANAIAAIEALLNIDIPVEIHSFDKSIAPLEFALQNKNELSYLIPHEEKFFTLLSEKKTSFGENGLWYFHEGDFRQVMQNTFLPEPHAIFYDPYSPSGNREMWELEHFSKFRERLGKKIPYLLTNYTRSTAVRVTLLMAGFYVGTGISIGEKEETTIVSNHLDLIERPLSRAWLENIRASGNAAPLRRENIFQSPINEEDFQELEKHEQFHFFLR